MLRRWLLYTLLTLIILAAPAFFVYSAIMQQAGLAVAQSTTGWVNLNDVSVGDGLTSGVGMFAPCLWNGASCDRQRGDTINGAQVNVLKLPASAAAAPVERGTLQNSRTASAANTTNTVTVTGVANQSVHIYKIQARCSGGSAFLQVSDGATLIYDTDGGTVPSGTQFAEFEWATGLSMTAGNNAVVTVGACGAGNISVINLEADQF
jgi:hypothetical protein